MHSLRRNYKPFIIDEYNYINIFIKIFVFIKISYIILGLTFLYGI